MTVSIANDEFWMSKALALARKGIGRVSPNPAVGAVIVQAGQEIGSGWHHRAGGPHAEVEAIRDADTRENSTRGATIYITLEPCSTHGRTPPCTEAILAAGIRRVVCGTTDPNPKHAGRGLELLRERGIRVTHTVLQQAAVGLNLAFNHWITTQRPLVTIKAAMTLDGRIATAQGESKWITGAAAGREAMKLRWHADAMLVGINTLIADDPALTCRDSRGGDTIRKHIRRIVLDTHARTPLRAKVVNDENRGDTLIVVSKDAPARRIAGLEKHVEVWRAPLLKGRISLRWLLNRLGRIDITHLLVEGGGEVNGAFIDQKLAHQIAFFYAPMLLGGTKSKPGIAGRGAEKLTDLQKLNDVKWRRLGDDLMMTAQIRA
ncbi:MAG: bifunctional diaminohydroxyphosphoribosylaminopyrimidine deaminase/5-amino-6-(5-phosphoribosylamino)uracil reductase RibD [Verrucomicrobiia bacterium]